MISPKKFCAHEVLGRPLAFGRGDLSFVWKEVTKFEEPWSFLTSADSLGWSIPETLATVSPPYSFYLKLGAGPQGGWEGTHIGVQLCPISAFSTEKFNWPARGTYSAVYRRKSTYKKIKPKFVIFHFESGNQDRYCRKIDADSAMFTSYLSQLSVIIKVSSLTYPVM